MSADNRKPWSQVLSDIRRHYIDYMFERFHATDEMANALANNDEEKVGDINSEWTMEFLFDKIDINLESPFKVEEHPNVEEGTEI